MTRKRDLPRSRGGSGVNAKLLRHNAGSCGDAGLLDHQQYGAVTAQGEVTLTVQ